MVAQLADQDTTSGALHQRDNAMLCDCSTYGIHFPVTELPSSLNGLGTLRNVSLSRQAVALLIRPIPLSVFPALSPVSVHLASPVPVSPDVHVDCLVAAPQ